MATTAAFSCVRKAISLWTSILFVLLPFAVCKHPPNASKPVAVTYAHINRSLAVAKVDSSARTWIPVSNYTVDDLRTLLAAEMLQFFQLTPGTPRSREHAFTLFNKSFDNPEYKQHGFMEGTEKYSPLRFMNRLWFSSLRKHEWSRRAMAQLDAEAGFTTSSTPGEQLDTSSCARAAKSVERANFLLETAKQQSLPPPEQAPNVIFIIADDLGWSDVGYHSSDVFSPFIDKLHTEGVVLNNYYVNLVCSPSRAAFLTGRYPSTTGVTDWLKRPDAVGLPLTEVTMGNMFREAGYDTHYVGKWHLGYYSPESTPTYRGFDSFYGLYGGAADYYRHLAQGNYDQRRDFTRNCGPGCSVVDYSSDGTYSTNMFAEEAVRRIMLQDPSSPLFLVVSFQAVHGPQHMPPFQYAVNCPARAPMPAGSGKLTAHELGIRMRLTACVTAMDNGIENITGALHHKGMLENSLIVFTTDNGAAVSGADSWGASNFPFRGGKHTIWEGGTHGVAAVWGAPVMRPRFKPFVSQRLMHGVDWFPTFRKLLDEWNLPASPRVRDLALDGVSQLDVLRDPNHDPAREGLVYGIPRDHCTSIAPINVTRALQETGCGFAIRDGDWKLVYHYGGYDDEWARSAAQPPKKPSFHKNGSWKRLCPDDYCLYNIAEDPLEMQEVRLCVCVCRCVVPESATAVPEDVFNNVWPMPAASTLGDIWNFFYSRGGSSPVEDTFGAENAGALESHRVSKSNAAGAKILLQAAAITNCAREAH